MYKAKKDELLFLPLGGANEIGMNVNLYHYKGKWLMFDLGAGFPDEHDAPGVNMLAPDLEFVHKNKKDFLGIVLTHAHEDHIGSITYLWGYLNCPIYATPFTAALIKAKLAGEGMDPSGKIHEIKPNSNFSVGPFNVEFVQITHSIPEMNGAVIRTEYGTIMHTGDWKIDPDPVIGPTTDEARLKAYGDEGVLCMVCDSTNVMSEGKTGSEGDLEESLGKIISEQRGMVVATTFASNVARLETLAKAAAKNQREVVLMGRSMHRIYQAARDTGYLRDIKVSDERHLSRIPKDRLMIICTGCQGEPQAALAKLVTGANPSVRLTPKDTVIFSSKIIPGNDTKLFAIYNKLVKMGVEVITERTAFVHVSGHPCREDLRQMYELIRPQIAIPVHGEAMHIHEHMKFAKKMGVPKQIEVENGSMVRIAPGTPEVIGQVHWGYLGVDGNMLIPVDGEVIQGRVNMRDNGVVFMSLLLDRKGRVIQAPQMMAPGLLDEQDSGSYIKELCADVADAINHSNHGTSDNKIATTARKVVRNYLRRDLGKFPAIKIQIFRV